MDQLVNQLVPIAGIAMITLIIWFVYRDKTAKARLRTDVQKDLIAKFSSGQELAEFLRTDGGKLFLSDPVGSSVASRQRVIRLVSGGVVLLALGLAFLVAQTDNEAAAFFGGIGAGLILAGLVIHVLARKMGLNDPQP